MLGNFTYENPTRLHFGPDALEMLNSELPQVGKTVQLIYGGGSIKKNGLYDKVVALLKKHGKTIVEDSGVMPNPTTDKLYEGVRIARESNADFLLAVGGGSCCDYAKAVAVSAYCEEDPWERFYQRFEEPAEGQRIIPVGVVLTMAGTGSEMNAGSVITHSKTRQKMGKVFENPAVKPRFAIMNPEFTMSLPLYQLKAGIYDIFNHLCEQYFSGTDDNTSDYINEGLLRSIVHDGPLAVANPNDYTVRSNIMWTATWALNTLVGKGKSQDWMVHMLGHAVGGHTNATHGMTLAAVSLPYYRFIMKDGLAKFRRFAINVWGVSPEGLSDEAIAEEGLKRMEAWMREVGVAMSISELGATEADIEHIAGDVLLLDGGYRKLTIEDVKAVLRAAL